MNAWGLYATALGAFTPQEAAVIVEAYTILQDINFQTTITFAREHGAAALVQIEDVKIQYEPGLPGSGFSMANDHGFIIGADVSIWGEGEEAKTVLHELHRLAISTIQQTGFHQDLGTEETQVVFAFAERAYVFLTERNLL